MMQAHLGVTSCDKCGEVMEKGQNILVVAEGVITEVGNELDFQGSCVRYACHLSCWDGVEEKKNTYNFTDAIPEERYNKIPKANLIVFGIYSVTRNGEGCTFERLVKQCFTFFPKAFGFSRYPGWPDSLKFDRPLRTLRERGWIVGGSRTLFSLTRFGEKVAEETEHMLMEPGLVTKPVRRVARGADTALIHFLKESAPFKNFLKDRQGFSITQMELRGLLRCTLETPLGVLKQNLQYTKNLASEYNEEKLLNFLEVCEQILTKKEGQHGI